jgi:ubiquinol-cytochrome c reductase cytochrome b subunit
MALRDWLDARTGYRAALNHVLREPLPGGTGWWFVLGSVVLFLLALQTLSGIVLSLYYVASPDGAYDSVRFVVTRVALGRFVRALHYFGASFLVIATLLHMTRVFVFGAHKPPRETTWISGVVLLLLMLGAGLTGYLLPWDQRAYWATVVAINMSASTPLVGEFIAGVLRGGADVGAMTLTRWYAAHVILIPAGIAALVVGHLYLMRRHGIAGPIVPRDAPARPFYPYHAIRDTTAIAVVLIALVVLAATTSAPLDHKADPADAAYIPRPEWYFLGLFQLLKYFPGRWEPVAAVGIPAILVAALLALPFLDRSPERHPRGRPVVSAAAAIVVAALVVLTSLGLRDTPANVDVDAWSARAVAGRVLARGDRCTTCHAEGGQAPAINAARVTRDDEWVRAHVMDPETIAPGFRPPPAGGLRRLEALAIIAYARQLRSGAREPALEPRDEAALTVFATRCSGCHVLDGEGGEDGPDLSHIGKKHNADRLHRWISDPVSIDPDADMPSFKDRLTSGEMDALVSFLSARK